MLLCIQELAEQGSSRPQDTSELLALKEQVSRLTAEKAALMEKNKKISKEKRGLSFAFVKQSTSLMHLVFIRTFFNQICSTPRIVKNSGEHRA